jgi:hypothetical protein
MRYRHSERAFAELVRRHVDFVYSAALRMVCDSHLAEAVTQGVFVALAKNAAQFTDRPVLSGWLYRPHKTSPPKPSAPIRSRHRRAYCEGKIHWHFPVSADIYG